MTAETLEILLVEDNPGDARLIEEMLQDVDELVRRVGAGGTDRRESRLRHVDHLSTGLDRLADGVVDVVLLDLGLPDSKGLDTLDAVAEATEFVPIVVLTGLRDEEIGLQAIQRGAQDYLVKEEVTSDLLVRSIHHAMERNRQERAQARQVEQLAAINRLNRISQEVTHAVITTTEREALEQAVCERFVDGTEYPFAWVGEIDHTTDHITARVKAGRDEGYIEETTITAGDDDTGQGPAGRAVRTRDVQVASDIQTDPDFEPWREQARERGYQSSAAVPITHESVLYGVLNLYAVSPNAFSNAEIEILARLGEVIGHAITAIERKDALVGDAVRELEFKVDQFGGELASLTQRTDGRIEFDHVVQTDDTLIAYGSVDGVSPTVLRETVAQSDAVGSLRFLDPDGEESELELVTSVGPDLFDAVVARGGVITSATVADGELRFIVQFPTGRDNRQLVELVQTHCPDAVPLAQRTVQRGERDVSTLPAVLQQELTEKQRIALETAYFGGYFDWPRTSTSEEIADRLGVTAATFTHHLRAAERKFFEELFVASQDDGEADSSPWTSLESGPTDR